MGNAVKKYENSNGTILRLCKRHSCASVSEIFLPQTNGEISPSIMQNWTKQAVECYEINANCANCSIGCGSYSFVCQMPKIVNALLKTYGPPQIEQELVEQD